MGKQAPRIRARPIQVGQDEIEQAHPLAVPPFTRYEQVDSVWIAYPFVPTHRVRLYRPWFGRRPAPEREEYVHLSAPQEGSGVAYGVVPAELGYPHVQERRYAVCPRGRWQALWSSLMVDAEPVELDTRKGKNRRTSGGQESGHVYLIQAGGRGGPVKIGYSANVGRRLRELQTANASELKLLGVLPGTFADEHALHGRFAQHRCQAEWFTCAPEILEHWGVQP